MQTIFLSIFSGNFIYKKKESLMLLGTQLVLLRNELMHCLIEIQSVKMKGGKYRSIVRDRVKGNYNYEKEQESIWKKSYSDYF